MLLTTTAFSYVHGQLETAIVTGICAGFVGGIAFTRWAADR
jgi:hypothetical protein